MKTSGSQGYFERPRAVGLQTVDTRRRIERMILRGVTNQYEIAASLNLTRENTTKLIREIYDQWRDDDPKDIEEMRTLRRRQFEYVLLQCLNSFELSRRGTKRQEEVDEACWYCNGEKRTEERPRTWVECSECKGEGFFKKTVDVYDERPGNAAYLRLAKELIGELAKVEGLVSSATLSNRSLLVAGKDAGGMLQTQVEELFVEAAPDVIIRAMGVLEELQESKGKPAPMVIEGQLQGS